MIDKFLVDFLKSGHILTIATIGEPVWIYPVYYTVDDELNFIFASSTKTEHGEFLKRDNKVAFCVTWVEEWNPHNKKGIQAKGVCEPITGNAEIQSAIDLFSKNTGIQRDPIKYLSENSTDKMYRISPDYIKYSDDENYGERGKRVFQKISGNWKVVEKNITTIKAL